MVTYFIDNYCPQYLLKPKTRKVFIVGLPKCATISFHHTLTFMGYKSAHHIVNDEYVGKIMLENHRQGKPLTSGKLEKYNAFTQMDFCDRTESVYPQMTLLEELIKQHPDGYFILNTRDLDGHISSILNWETFAQDLERNGHFKLGRTLEDHVQAVGKWILDHQEKVRKTFAETYPNVSFLELRIDDAEVEDKLKVFFGSPKLMFPHLNHNRVRRHRNVISYNDVSSNNKTAPQSVSQTAKGATTTSLIGDVPLVSQSSDLKVIVLGLPRGKQEAILRLARKLSLTSVHQRTKTGTPLATIMKENAQNHRNLLEGEELSNVNVLTGLELFEKGTSEWPQWTLIKDLVTQYPNAKFILNKRNVTEHIDAIMSSTNDHQEKYFNLFLSETVPGFRHDGRLHPVYLSRWIAKYYAMIESVFQSHPDVAFLDVNMDDPSSHRQISSFLA